MRLKENSSVLLLIPSYLFHSNEGQGIMHRSINVSFVCNDEVFWEQKREKDDMHIEQ